MLRTEAIRARNALPTELRQEWSMAIQSKFVEESRERNFRSIHCYLSIRSEVETGELVERLLASGIRITVPIVEASATSRILGHSEITSLSSLARGPFGLAEPTERNSISLETLDAVIVPLVAFDRTGTRLGYGLGFYDRFLRSLPASVERIGLAFQMQEVPYIPAFTHDERLDAILTEHEIIRVKR
ncbi:MAG TPA: 5-formyltetrahydrofolate cyclo-ligase [Candidatus Kapabacteria bacterium]